MVTRRPVPRRRRPRTPKKSWRFIVVGAVAVIIVGLFLGAFMGQQRHKNTKLPIAIVHPKGIPDQPAVSSILPILTPKPTPATSSRPTAYSSPSHVFAYVATASPPAAMSVEPMRTNALQSARPLPVHHSPVPSATMHELLVRHNSQIPKYHRYPVTAEMLSGTSLRAPVTAAAPTPVVPVTTPPASAAPSAVAAGTVAPPPPRKREVLKTAPRPVANVVPSTYGAMRIARRYLTALIQGNETEAYALLGGKAGDRGLNLSEEAFIERGTTISGLVAQADKGGSNVQAEVASPKGLYFVTFRVEPHNGRLTIIRHDYIKP